MPDDLTPAPAPPGGIVETCLYVADIDRARDFYIDLFGFELMDSDERFCAFNLGPARVLLLFLRHSANEGAEMPFGFIPPHDCEGQIHIGFSIPAGSVESWRARLQERKIAIESEFTWPQGGTSLYFRDPDQNLLELLTPGVWPNY